MQKRLAVIAVAGTIGLGAAGVTALAIPALAANTPTPSTTASPKPSASPAPDSTAAQDARQKAITDQLKSLVDDGTLTQAQADKVAEKLAAAKELPGLDGPHRGFGGPGMGFGAGIQQLEDAAAKALGLSVDDLRTQLRSGSTLADIAKKQNKDVTTLTSTLTKAAQAQLTQAVKDKKITQEMADQIGKNLPAQVKSFVENGRMMHQFRMRGGPWGKDDVPAPAPSAPTPSGGATDSSFFGNA
jgi:hypothetical protein